MKRKKANDKILEKQQMILHPVGDKNLVHVMAPPMMANHVSLVLGENVSVNVQSNESLETTTITALSIAKSLKRPPGDLSYVS